MRDFQLFHFPHDGAEFRALHEKLAGEGWKFVIWAVHHAEQKVAVFARELAGEVVTELAEEAAAAVPNWFKGTVDVASSTLGAPAESPAPEAELAVPVDRVTEPEIEIDEVEALAPVGDTEPAPPELEPAVETEPATLADPSVTAPTTEQGT